MEQANIGKTKNSKTRLVDFTLTITKRILKEVLLTQWTQNSKRSKTNISTHKIHNKNYHIDLILTTSSHKNWQLQVRLKVFIVFRTD